MSLPYARRSYASFTPYTTHPPPILRVGPKERPSRRRRMGGGVMNGRRWTMVVPCHFITVFRSSLSHGVQRLQGRKVQPLSLHLAISSPSCRRAKPGPPSGYGKRKENEARWMNVVTDRSRQRAERHGVWIGLSLDFLSTRDPIHMPFISLTLGPQPMIHFPSFTVSLTHHLPSLGSSFV